MSPETAERILDNHGLAVALIVVGVVGCAWGVRAVWSFLRPRIENHYERMEHFLTTIEENSSRAARAIDALTDEGRDGHTKTHDRLAAVHEDVRHIRNKVEGRT